MFIANRYIRIGTMNFSIIMCSLPQCSPVTEGGVQLEHTLYLFPNVVIHFSGAEYHPRMILCTFSHSIIRSQSEPSNFKWSDYALRNSTSFLDVLVVVVFAVFLAFIYSNRIHTRRFVFLSELNEPNGL